MPCVSCRVCVLADCVGVFGPAHVVSPCLCCVVSRCHNVAVWSLLARVVVESVRATVGSGVEASRKYNI